jgi:hypothetical protein
VDEAIGGLIEEISGWGLSLKVCMRTIWGGVPLCHCFCCYVIAVLGCGFPLSIYCLKIT